MSEEVRNLFPKDMKCVDALPIANYIEELKQEHKQLQNNWNELKDYLEKQIIDSKAGGSQQYYFNTIYKYMQELEGKDV